MGKYLLLIVAVFVLYWLLRAGIRRRRQGGPPSQKAAQDMVRCASCGVHLPRGESLALRGKFYCCEEHRRRDEG